MISRLLQNGSAVSQLRAGLTDSTERVRRIAHRVANASSGVAGDFQSAMDEVREGEVAYGGREVDMEREMVSLAEEQLRYEATSQLLRKVYQQIRSSVRQG